VLKKYKEEMSDLRIKLKESEDRVNPNEGTYLLFINFPFKHCGKLYAKAI